MAGIKEFGREYSDWVEALNSFINVYRNKYALSGKTVCLRAFGYAAIVFLPGCAIFSYKQDKYGVFLPVNGQYWL